MRIEMLREFVTFAKVQNFSIAAEELHLSQPTMSVHIANLEKELGFKLVERKGNITLTPEGQRFLAGVQTSLESFDKAVYDCQAMRGGYPSVRIRTTGNMPFLIDILGNINDVPFELLEIPTDTLAPFAEIEKNIVDISTCYDISFSKELSTDVSQRGINLVSVGVDNMKICMTKTNPLAEKVFLSKKDLKGATVILTSSKWYDFMAFQVKHLLGEDLDLKFRMVPMTSPLSQRYIGLEDSITLSGINSEYFTVREDVAVFDRLDNKKMSLDIMMAYLEDNPNPNVDLLIEKIRKNLPSR